MDITMLRPKDMPELEGRLREEWPERNAAPGEGASTSLWWVSRDMIQAAKDAPFHPDLHVDHELVPIRELPHGIIGFERPLITPLPDGDFKATVAIEWCFYKGDLRLSFVGPQVMWERFLGDEEPGNAYRLLGADGIRLPQVGVEDSYEDMSRWGQQHVDGIVATRSLCHFLLLANTPTAATATPRTIPGAKIKGQRRRQAPSDVKIVELRTMKHQTVTHSPSGRQYTHRWIVRGHWRDQACGPGNKLRRRTWVPAYTKGPDGAPLLEKETVFAWRR